MASSIVTVRRQRKAKTAIQGKTLFPINQKLQPLASGSVHEERVFTQVTSGKWQCLETRFASVNIFTYIDPKV